MNYHENDIKLSIKIVYDKKLMKEKYDAEDEEKIRIELNEKPFQK